MPVPEVSHKNWERIRGLCQIHLGTTKVRAEELSFEKRLSNVLSYNYNSLRDDASSGGVYHSDWGKDGVVIIIEPNAQTRAHRPEVTEETATELHEDCRYYYPNIPVESLSFNRQLDLLLDRAEEYTEAVNCVLKPPEAGEMAQMTGRDIVR